MISINDVLKYIGLLVLVLITIIVCSWGLVILVDWLFPDLYKIIDRL